MAPFTEMYLAWAEKMLWRLWPCQQQQRMRNDGLRWHARPSGSSQLKLSHYSEMVCMPLFCTQPNVPRGCYLAWICVCLCVSVWVSSLQRGGWSGLENILCDSTSGLASLYSDISLSLLHCNSLTIRSLCFVQVSVLKGMMWQPVSFANLKPYQRKRWRKSVYAQKKGKYKQRKRLLWACAGLDFIFHDCG